MIGVSDDQDSRTGIPVASLYGSTFESLAPRPEHLAEIDVLVIDLQDVGSRYYTYVWTMVLSLEAAFAAGVAVVVLDRPNPLGGVAIEGGSVGERFRSFVGLCPVPVRHGLTIAEIARLRAAGMTWAGDARFARPLDGDLTVIPMRGWRRAMTFARDGPALGDAVAQHADARHGAGLSGAVPVRSHEPVGGAGHDAPVRAGRGAVPGRLRLGRRGGVAGRAPAAALVPADVPQVRGAVLRGCPAARDRPGGVPPLRDRAGADRGGAPAVAGGLPLANRAVRVRGRPARHRPSDGRRPGAARDRRRRAAGRGPGRGCQFERTFAEVRRPALVADYA